MPGPTKDSKLPKDASASNSRDLVRVGPRHVSARHGGRRNDDGQKPTTARALVLRNGKHGAMGTGELVLSNKISGREKLDLLAGELNLQRTQQATMGIHLSGISTLALKRGSHGKSEEGCFDPFQP